RPSVRWYSSTPATGHHTPRRRSPPRSRSLAAAPWPWTTPASTAASSRWPRRCSTACSPHRRSRTTCRSPSATGRPAPTSRSAATGTTPSSSPTGPRCWSSAGHLPPLLLRPGGTVEALDSPPERLLGSGSPCVRSDQEVLLSPGDTVVFYTDGLIEYGRTGIDEGIDRLTGHLADLAELPLEDLCDGLLDRVPPGRADDDIAILALRCRPDQQPNTAESSHSG